MRRKRIDEIAADLEYCKEKGVPPGYYFRANAWSAWRQCHR